MNTANKRKLLITTYVIAFLIGCIHFGIGLQAIFVFRNNEPLTSWLAVIGGLLATLPATILALFKRKLGGYWLIIIGGILSATLIFSKEFSFADILSLEALLRIGLIIILPIGLGSSFLYLSKEQDQKITAN
jgi:hypothetical protein